MKYSTEIRGGFEAALQGASTNVTPVLLFAAVLGSSSLTPALWGVIATLAVVPWFRWLLGGHPSVLPGIRSASLATYVALVAQLAMTGAGVATNPSHAPLDAQQVAMGLAAGSALFLVTALLILLAGALKLGNIFKMIPTPVTAGISNGTALLLAWLAIREALHGSMFAWVSAAAMLLGYVLWQKAQKRWRSLVFAPAIAVAIAIGILCGWWLEPSTLAVAAPRLSVDVLDWLPWNLWRHIPPDRWGHLLMVGLPGAVTLALIMILETVTTTNAMEMRFGQRTDANRELMALGGSNIVACVAGGLPSSGGLIYSLANRSAGGQGRVSVLVCFGLTLTSILLLTPQMMHMAPGLAAGLLALQAGLMVQPGFPTRIWGLIFGQARERQHDLGLWITLAIAFVGFAGNLVWACFLGVSLSCLLVLRRVSVNLTARWANLDRYRSRRVRSPAETDTLAQLAHQVAVLRLTGHLFFGNSTRLIQLGDELHTDTQAVVVDVSQVSDADPSGCDAIDWLIGSLVARGLVVTLSGLAQTPATDLRVRLQGAQGVHFHPDMDRALEACEDLVLTASTQRSAQLLSQPLAANSLLRDLTTAEIEAVLAAGERRSVEQSQVLFLKNTAADGVWLLESGHVSILASDAPDAPRLATFGPGQFVGEMGFIDGKTRSATARADTAVTAFLLDNQAIAALSQKAPETVLTITRNIARELSHRVRSTSNRLEQASAEPAQDWANNSLDLASRF